MADQTWKIPVSPAQRFQLLQLSHEKGQQLQGQQGRVFRRFMRAFALLPIRDALRKYDNRAASKLLNGDELALFEITAETRDYVLGLEEKVNRHPSSEMVLGDLWDVLEATKKDYTPPEDVPAFDAAAEDWAPEPEEKADLIDEIGERVSALDAAALRAVLASLPAPPQANGAASSSSAGAPPPA